MLPGQHGDDDHVAIQRLARIARNVAGVVVPEDKLKLLATRVARRQEALGFANLPDYASYVEDDATGAELRRFLDVVTTGYTSFFREPDHFEVLSEHVRNALREGRRKLRLWSAASSTGEEPFSMAISMLEHTEGRKVDTKILATDISQVALETARAALYSSRVLGAVSPTLMLKYFTKRDDNTEQNVEQSYRVKNVVRSHVVFRRLNLAAPPYPMKGPLDIIFCRNVMIYFDNPTRQRLIGEVERLLRPGGLLVTSHTETLMSVSTSLGMVRPSIYFKVR